MLYSYLGERKSDNYFKQNSCHIGQLNICRLRSKIIYEFIFPCDFTAFVVSPLNPWIVTHPRANRGSSCLTFVILGKLVFLISD